MAASQSAAVDDSFNLGQPAVYAALVAVREGGIPAVAADEALSIGDWSALLERPDDFRGRLVRVSGVVGRNTSWRLHTPPLDELGVIGEVQIRAADQPITCKLLMTSGGPDIPIGASVTFIGRFAMIQRYYGTSGKEQRAAVIVGVGPSEIVTSGPARQGESRQGVGPIGWVSVAAGGMFVAWLLVRARAKAPLREHAALSAREPASMSVADDFAAWSGESGPHQPDRGDRSGGAGHD